MTQVVWNCASMPTYYRTWHTAVRLDQCVCVCENKRKQTAENNPFLDMRSLWLSNQIGEGNKFWTIGWFMCVRLCMFLLSPPVKHFHPLGISSTASFPSMCVLYLSDRNMFAWWKIMQFLHPTTLSGEIKLKLGVINRYTGNCSLRTGKPIK